MLHLAACHALLTRAPATVLTRTGPVPAGHPSALPARPSSNRSNTTPGPARPQPYSSSSSSASSSSSSSASSSSASSAAAGRTSAAFLAVRLCAASASRFLRARSCARPRPSALAPRPAQPRPAQRPSTALTARARARDARHAIRRAAHRAPGVRARRAAARSGGRAFCAFRRARSRSAVSASNGPYASPVTLSSSSMRSSTSSLKATCARGRAPE